MRLTVIGSGSSGNCYVLQNDSEAIVLEAGMPIQDCLAVLEYNVSKVVGCFVTHEHGDHAKYIEKYMEYFPCYCSAGTAKAITYSQNRRPIEIEVLKTLRVGTFAIRPIEAEHDAAEPFAYIIDHQEIGRLLFATDTYCIRYTIPNLNNIMVECNYSLPILYDNIERGLVPAALKNRTLESHMSLDNLKHMLNANDLRGVAQIILIHLSGRNSDTEAFVREIEKQTGKRTIAAKRGLTADIFKDTPF